MLVLGVAALTASAMFLALAAFARHIPGVRFWAMGSMAVGFATILDGPRFVSDWQLASMLFNVPFSIGQAFILAGTMQFCARPRATSMLWLMAVLVAVLTAVLTYIVPDSVLRIGSLSLYQAAINLWTAYILWRHADPFARRAFRVAAVVALFQSAAALAQGVLVVNSTLAVTYASPEMPLANIISWAGAMLNVLVGNWILFLLIMLRLVADLRVAAERDLLTGLLNRRGIRARIDAILHRGQGGAGSMGIMILDIDHFKRINDTHGHDMGDRVLVIMGKVLLAMRLPGATPCRWGGEEFCIVVDGMGRDAMLALADRVRSQFQADSAALDGMERGSTVSVGIASARLDAGFDMSQLVSLADAQLYQAKSAGRDRVAFGA